MSTNSSTGGEWAAFSQFVETRLADDSGVISLEQRVAEFRAYQRDLEKLRMKLGSSLEQVDRGESKSLDDDQFWAKANRRFDELGIPE